ncbi:MAG: polysaccharide deacetylase family protein [Xanthobacteraceae bacterium]
MQYPESLPLADHEVVLTFDDGPLPPHTGRILETLASECVKATFFLVGRMAKAYPEWVRKIHEAGHTIGTHSQNHPLRFHHMTAEQVDREVATGIASVAAALGDDKALAPFFRIPGLLRSGTVEHYLVGKSLMAWSADFPADDWLRISGKKIAERALQRIEARRGGMLLLHDIKPSTVQALPIILQELKKRGYRIVHVEPASAEHPKTVTRIADWASRKRLVAKRDAPAQTVTWPRPALTIELLLAEPALPVPDPLNFGLGLASHSTIALVPQQSVYASAQGDIPLPPKPPWPPVATVNMPTTLAQANAPVLPVPGPKSFGIGNDVVPVIPAGAVEKRHAAVPDAPSSQVAARGPQNNGDVTGSIRRRRVPRRPVATAGLLDFLFSSKTARSR